MGISVQLFTVLTNNRASTGLLSVNQISYEGATMPFPAFGGFGHFYFFAWASELARS
jgi:hypothetical protein